MLNSSFFTQIILTWSLYYLSEAVGVVKAGPIYRISGGKGLTVCSLWSRSSAGDSSPLMKPRFHCCAYKSPQFYPVLRQNWITMLHPLLEDILVFFHLRIVLAGDFISMFLKLMYHLSHVCCELHLHGCYHRDDVGCSFSAPCNFC